MLSPNEKNIFKSLQICDRIQMLENLLLKNGEKQSLTEEKIETNAKERNKLD